MSKVIGEVIRQKDSLLTPELIDDQARRRIMQFLQTMETAVLEANCEVIGKQLPQLNDETFLRMAVRVAELRADYVAAGIALAEHRHPPAPAVDKLVQHRRAYEEMVAVFEAAQRVIERGYVKLK